MTLIGKNTRVQFELNGQQIDAPLNWMDIGVLATFDNESNQANVTTETFEFALDAARKIREHISGGLTGGVGIFEGIPFKITASNIDNSLSAFDGFLDLTDEFQDDYDKNRVFCKIKKDDGLNLLNDRISAITYGWLYDQGHISDSDFLSIDYIIEKKINAFEILTSGIILYIMSKELAEAVKRTVDAINQAQAHFAGGITGTVAAAIWAVANAIIVVAYTALLLIAVVELGNKLMSTFYPPTRKHKVTKFKTLIERVCQYLGYNLETNIADLDHYYFLPSNPNLDDVNSSGFIQTTKGTQAGIPNSQDYGYSCIEMFELAKDMFNAKYTLIGDTVHFRNVDDPFWIEQSTYQMPDVILPAKGYNTNDLAATRMIAFKTDTFDEWTVDNFTGTNYLVTTDANDVQNQTAKYLKGIDEIRLPVALGNRKTELNALETTVAALANIIDSVTGIFGGGTNLENSVRRRVGMLKVSNNYHTIPKILYLSGTNIANNHRDLLSAKYLYENYHIGKSFVSNNWYGQKTKYNAVKIPFGLNDFLNLINNSYFYTQDGKVAKMEKIEWLMGQDHATVDLWIREPYTNNLNENFIEP